MSAADAAAQDSCDDSPPSCPPHSPAPILAIEGEMTIYRAADLKKALIGALAADAPIRVDLSRVTELDTAGVQLLVLARHIADDRKKELVFLAPSEAVRAVLQLLNLDRQLGTR